MDFLYDLELDPVLLFAVGGGLLLAVALLIAYRVRHRRPSAEEAGVSTGYEEGAETPLRDTRISEPDRREEAARRRKKTIGDPSCEHHFEISGFPADKLGTHVILTCSKCQGKFTVTLEESKEFLRQRDDVREALRRARGD